MTGTLDPIELKAKCHKTEQPTREVCVTPDTQEKLLRNGPRQKAYQLYGDRDTGEGSIVEWTLVNASAICDGTRKFSEGGRCYAAKAPYDWDFDGVKGFRIDPPPKQIFEVYVDQNGEVYDWSWGPADPNDDTLPIDHSSNGRFSKGLLWPK